MAFSLIEILDLIIEVEQVETGHRMTFFLLEDRADIARGSFRPNQNAGNHISKDCWKGAYLHARRAAIKAGLLRVEQESPPPAGSGRKL